MPILIEHENRLERVPKIQRLETRLEIPPNQRDHVDLDPVGRIDLESLAVDLESVTKLPVRSKNLISTKIDWLKCMSFRTHGPRINSKSSVSWIATATACFRRRSGRLVCSRSIAV